MNIIQEKSKEANNAEKIPPLFFSYITARLSLMDRLFHLARMGLIMVILSDDYFSLWNNVLIS